ncbi:MAG: hypothetical protein ABFS41_11715 [Myxococcota bacterium]
MNVAATWGTTEEERTLAFPCDGFVDRVDAACWRGVTVEADAATLFRWLCQLRVAPYSYDWIDNGGRQSPRALTPGLERLEVGQRVMRIFDLVAFEPERHLTLRTRRLATRSWPAVAVSYLLRPDTDGTTRLVAKLAIQARPGRLGALLTRALVIGDFVMMRRQLLNLKALAEATRAGRAPSP